MAGQTSPLCFRERFCGSTNPRSNSCGRGLVAMDSQVLWVFALRLCELNLPSASWCYDHLCLCFMHVYFQGVIAWGIRFCRDFHDNITSNTLQHLSLLQKKNRQRNLAWTIFLWMTTCMERLYCLLCPNIAVSKILLIARMYYYLFLRYDYIYICDNIALRLFNCTSFFLREMLFPTL